MKNCSSCGENKTLQEFNVRKASKDGFTTICKICSRLKSKEYKKKNTIKISEYNKKYQINYDSEKRKEIHKVSYKKNIKTRKNYLKKNKDRISEYNKNYYENNKEYFKLKNKEQSQKESRKEYQRNYANNYNKKRKKEDVLYLVKSRLRCLISNSFYRKGYKKHSKSHEILGCDFESFKKYLESKFKEWMNWDNYGLYNGDYKHGWDLDHIIPLSSALTIEDIIKLNHFSNLQPLCSKINRNIKKNNIEYENKA